MLCLPIFPTYRSIIPLNCHQSAPLVIDLASLVIKILPAMQETLVWSLGREDALKKGLAIHSRILLGEFHGHRNVVGYSPWGRKALDITEWLTLSVFSFLQLEILQELISPVCLPGSSLSSAALGASQSQHVLSYSSFHSVLIIPSTYRAPTMCS